MHTGVDPRTGLEDLEYEECLRLVGASAIGRLAVVIDHQPLAFPVNFTLDGDVVVLRTDAGTKLYAGRHGLVAFECDGIDPMYHTGWSVIITGRVQAVTEQGEIARLQRLPLGPWCPGPKPVWLRIEPRTVTGRRIPPHGMYRTEPSERVEQ